jgi:uncharacterized membrane protein
MRVVAAHRIDAPIETTWAIASDPRQALSFMSGVTRWEVAGEQETGRGARYRMLIRIGSAEIGGLIELVEWHPPFDFAWHSVTGLDQRGRLRLRAVPGPVPRTLVEFRLAYGIAGSGLSGWIAEHVAAPTVKRHLGRSLVTLGRLAEQEQRRTGGGPQRRAMRSSA